MGEVMFRLILVGLFFVAGCGERPVVKHSAHDTIMESAATHVPAMVCALFPRTVKEIDAYEKYVLETCQREVTQLHALKLDEISESFLYQYDYSQERIRSFSAVMSLLSNVSPDDAVRKRAKKAAGKANGKSMKWYVSKKFSKAFYACEKLDAGSFTDDERFFLSLQLDGLRRKGPGYVQGDHKKIKKYARGVSSLKSEFRSNISRSRRSLVVTKDELQGLRQEFIDGLKRDGDNYVVKCDYPTSYIILAYAENEGLRKKFYTEFNSRAHPENDQILRDLIGIRNAEAQTLGFKNYAEYNLGGETAKTVDHVKGFLDAIWQKSAIKSEQEFEFIKANMPPSVSLNAQGKLNAWDFEYVVSYLKKKLYHVSSKKLADYFPFKQVFDGMLMVYSKVLGVTFKSMATDGLWANGLLGLQVFDNATQEVRGYIIVDPFVRKNKYPRACHQGIIRPQRRKDFAKKTFYNVPGVSVTIFNFSQEISGAPSLLSLKGATSLFHEFGHAMHSIFARTTFSYVGGTSVPRDFAEMPSQLFEQWVLSKEVLPLIAKHYKTGQLLEDEVVQKLRNVERLNAGMTVSMQLWRALISLGYYEGAAGSDLDGYARKIWERVLPYIEYPHDVYFRSCFQHLASYGARYYAYLWSKVMAMEVYGEFAKDGIFNQDVGLRLRDKILSKGNSMDPRVQVENFLGKPVSYDGFFTSCGFVETGQ